MPNLQGKIELIKQAQVDIKNDIIDKGVTPTGNISTYADAIDSIVTPNNQTKTVTENGVVRYDAGYTGLEQVTVNVNQSVQNKNITTNGTYTADSGYVGLGVVTVDVSPDVTTKTITANGTYNASSDNVDGYSSVTVNVQDDKKMNYFEDTYGFYYNFSYWDVELSHVQYLLIGSPELSVKLNRISSISVPVQYCSLSAVEEITIDEALKQVFKGHTNLLMANFNNLKLISYNNIFYETFRECTNLQTINFPLLNSNSFGSYTNQFSQMLAGVTGCTVHFPSNLQSVIGSWGDVQNGFGGTNTTVLFDLPATT